MELKKDMLFHNRYRLIQSKGRGSFGEVWLAHDEEMCGMEVALKVYVALDPIGMEEFKSEYMNTFGLNHPNLLHANHFDTFGDRPYLVMPYCPNSAMDLIGNYNETQMWRFVHDVASGLAYLHERNIIHHDIKPENILIDEAGRFMITDFGISVKIRSTLRKNANNHNPEGGTIPFMAPELFTANAEAINASDIWALGVTMVDLLTGELPFFGRGGVLQLNGAKIPEIHCDCSEDLKSIIKQCLSLESWERPTAKQLVQYSEKALQGKQVFEKKEESDFEEDSTSIVDIHDERNENSTTAESGSESSQAIANNVSNHQGSVRFVDSGEIDKDEENKKTPQNDVPRKSNASKPPKKKLFWLPIVVALVVLAVGGYFVYNWIVNEKHIVLSPEVEESIAAADSLLMNPATGKEGLDMLQKLMQEGENRYEATFLMSRLFFNPTDMKGIEFYNSKWTTMRGNCGITADASLAHQYLMDAYQMKGEDNDDYVLFYELGCDFLYARGIPDTNWSNARWCFKQVEKIISKGVDTEDYKKYKKAIEDKLIATSAVNPLKP